MKIVFAGITLGDDAGGLPISARTVNGEAVSEAVDIVQAARKRFYYRGNEAVTLSFSVRREFATLKEAEVFWLTQWSLLPKSGLCTITCGQEGDEADVLLTNAVLTASTGAACRGVEALLNYTIAAPEATTDEPPAVLTGAQPMILRAATALAADDESKAIVFDTPFAAAPVVAASVAKPSGGDNIFATMRHDLVTVNGFTVEFSAPIPDAGYYLHWAAVGA